MRYTREQAEKLGIDFDAGRLKADRPEKPLVESIRPLPPRTETKPPTFEAGYYLRILDWRPASKNEIDRRGRKARIQLGRECDAMISEAQRRARLPPPEGKRRVTILLELPDGQRSFDPDALQKAVGDAMVDAGVLKNDSDRWVEWGPTSQPRTGRMALTLLIEDL